MATRMCLAFCLLIPPFVDGSADDRGYWSLELPVPESASNAVNDASLDFLTKTISFAWRGRDVNEIRDFYSRFFESIGWEDPLADAPRFSDLNQSGWSSYSMRFDDYNNPVAAYAMMWQAQDYPALGTVTVILNDLDDGELVGSVLVSTTPDVDLAVLLRLNGLIGNDPRNLFKLHNAVNGNPFELHTIALPANYAEETDPLLAEYYAIVDEIRAVYQEWGREYVFE